MRVFILGTRAESTVQCSFVPVGLEQMPRLFFCLLFPGFLHILFYMIFSRINAEFWLWGGFKQKYRYATVRHSHALLHFFFFFFFKIIIVT